MKPFTLMLLTLGLLSVVAGSTADSRYPGPARGDQLIYTGAEYRPGAYSGYHPRSHYGSRYTPYLPGEGEVLSEKTCRNPTFKQVCVQDYEIIPGAIWKYFYRSETTRQHAENQAVRFARRHNGLVAHEGVAYVVYRPVTNCEYKVSACEALVDGAGRY